MRLAYHEVQVLGLRGKEGAGKEASNPEERALHLVPLVREGVLTRTFDLHCASESPAKPFQGHMLSSTPKRVTQLFGRYFL